MPGALRLPENPEIVFEYFPLNEAPSELPPVHVKVSFLPPPLYVPTSPYRFDVHVWCFEIVNTSQAPLPAKVPLPSQFPRLRVRGVHDRRTGLRSDSGPVHSQEPGCPVMA